MLFSANRRADDRARASNREPMPVIFNLTLDAKSGPFFFEILAERSPIAERCPMTIRQSCLANWRVAVRAARVQSFGLAMTFSRGAG